jgi:hypothetical protein
MNIMSRPIALSHKALSISTPSDVPLETTSSKAHLAPSAQWVEYFAANAARPCEIPWQLGSEGISRNLAVIAKSLRAWQLGESSDGRRLVAVAQRYGAREGDPLFLDTMRFFIAEEQRHGAVLGRWLDLAGIPRARHNWGDSCFRILRHGRPEMEFWVTTVVMVETHAMIYYRAIHRATDSPVLRGICERILADEVPHIRFQCERLARILRGRGPLFRRMTLLFHRVFFTGITLAVWSAHGPALKAGGYSFRRFWRVAWTRMWRAWRAMDPEQYAWKEA